MSNGKIKSRKRNRKHPFDVKNLQSAANIRHEEWLMLQKYGRYAKALCLNGGKETLINSGSNSYRKIKQNYAE